MNAKIVVRKAVESDKPMIMSAWLSGQYFGSPHWSQMPKDVFYAEYADVINTILRNPNTTVELAVLEDDPNTLLGFVVYSKTALHWIYTKKDYRSQGIMNLLIPPGILTVSSTTLPGAAIARKKKLKFNPFLKGDV